MVIPQTPVRLGCQDTAGANKETEQSAWVASQEEELKPQFSHCKQVISVIFTEQKHKQEAMRLLTCLYKLANHKKGGLKGTQSEYCVLRFFFFIRGCITGSIRWIRIYFSRCESFQAAVAEPQPQKHRAVIENNVSSLNEAVISLLPVCSRCLISHSSLFPPLPLSFLFFPQTPFQKF